MELADVLDSKSSGSDTVSVRPRSPAPKKTNFTEVRLFYFFTLIYSLLSKKSVFFKTDFSMFYYHSSFGQFFLNILLYGRDTIRPSPTIAIHTRIRLLQPIPVTAFANTRFANAAAI